VSARDDRLRIDPGMHVPAALPARAREVHDDLVDILQHEPASEHERDANLPAVAVTLWRRVHRLSAEHEMTDDPDTQAVLAYRMIELRRRMARLNDRNDPFPDPRRR
jgi:hypothetical protein